MIVTSCAFVTGVGSWQAVDQSDQTDHTQMYEIVQILVI